MNTLFDGFSKKFKPEGIKWKQGFIVQKYNYEWKCLQKLRNWIYLIAQYYYTVLYLKILKINAASVCFGCV